MSFGPKLLYAAFISLTLPVPPLAWYCCWNACLLAASTAAGLFASTLFLFATKDAPATTAVAMAKSLAPPLPPFFGKNVLDTPLTSMPAVLPITSVSRLNPCCLSPSLLKLLIQPMIFAAAIPASIGLLKLAPFVI